MKHKKQWLHNHFGGRRGRGKRNGNNYNSFTGFEVPTVVVIQNSVFWDITPSSLLKVNRHFGGICDLHRQGWRISQAKNQHKTLLATCFMLVLTWLILWPWRWGWHIPPKCQLTFSGLHDIILQKTEYFLNTITVPQAVRINTMTTACTPILFGNCCVCTLYISKLKLMPT
jgi:hypothetical protein